MRSKTAGRRPAVFSCVPKLGKTLEPSQHIDGFLRRRRWRQHCDLTVDRLYIKIVFIRSECQEQILLGRESDFRKLIPPWNSIAPASVAFDCIAVEPAPEMLKYNRRHSEDIQRCEIRVQPIAAYLVRQFKYARNIIDEESLVMNTFGAWTHHLTVKSLDCETCRIKNRGICLNTPSSPRKTFIIPIFFVEFKIPSIILLQFVNS